MTTNDNKCTIGTVGNCAELEAVDSCKVCNSGFKIEVSNGKNTCQSFTKANCIRFE